MIPFFYKLKANQSKDKIHDYKTAKKMMNEIKKMKHRKILIPTDIMHDEDPLLRYSVEIAQIMELGLLLVGLIDLSSFSAQNSQLGYTRDVIPMDFQGMKKAKEEYLKNLAKKIKDREFSDVEYTVEMGAVPQDFLRLTESEEIDLVLLSGDKDVGFFDKIFGNLNQQIINNCKKPILFIPYGKKFSPLKKIIFSTKYSKEDIRSLQYLIKYLRNVSPEISALHITDDQDFKSKITQKGFKKHISDQLDYPKVNFRQLEGNDIPGKILEFCKTSKADLIAIRKEEHSFFEQLFHKNTTKKLLYESDYPLLII